MRRREARGGECKGRRYVREATGLKVYDNLNLYFFLCFSSSHLSKLIKSMQDLVHLLCIRPFLSLPSPLFVEIWLHLLDKIDSEKNERKWNIALLTFRISSCTYTLSGRDFLAKKHKKSCQKHSVQLNVLFFKGLFVIISVTQIETFTWI